MDVDVIYCAENFIESLGYGKSVINGIKNIYNSNCYLPPVLVKKGNGWGLVPHQRKKGKNIYIFEDGEPFIFDEPEDEGHWWDDNTYHNIRRMNRQCKSC